MVLGWILYLCCHSRSAGPLRARWSPNRRAHQRAGIRASLRGGATSALAGRAADHNRVQAAGFYLLHLSSAGGRLLSGVRHQLELAAICRPRLLPAGHRRGGVGSARDSLGAGTISQLPPAPCAPSPSDAALDPSSVLRGSRAAFGPCLSPSTPACGWGRGGRPVGRREAGDCPEDLLVASAPLRLLWGLLAIEFLVVYCGADWITAQRAMRIHAYANG